MFKYNIWCVLVNGCLLTWALPPHLCKLGVSIVGVKTSVT